MGFVYLFLYFVVVDNAITLFNCFFRDFRGFRDFRVFDLAIFKSNYFEEHLRTAASEFRINQKWN